MINTKIVSSVACSLLVKFVAEDDHIYNLDDSWNVTIGDFQLSNRGNTKLQIKFSFQAKLRSVDKKGHSTVLLPHEDLPEMQPYLEKLEILLDLLSLQVGIPLAIEDGSFEFNAVGYSTKSNPITNTSKLYDLIGLEKRYQNMLKNENLVNATRFFRLSQIDREYNGKAIKLWATLEALFKGYKREIKTIWSKLKQTDKNKLESIINSLPIKVKEKQSLLNAIRERKLLSPTELLSRKIKLMNSNGEYSERDTAGLVSWWSKSRNNPAHGERIKRNDEDKQDAIDDLENTLETLLEGDLTPSVYGYFIGHPDDVDGNLWNKDDHTIRKLSKRCWIKPSHLILGANDQLFKDIGHHKVKDNAPFLFVSHNRIISMSKEAVIEVTDLDSLPKVFVNAVKRVQKKLNKEEDGSVGQR